MLLHLLQFVGGVDETIIVMDQDIRIALQIFNDCLASLRQHGALLV